MQKYTICTHFKGSVDVFFKYILYTIYDICNPTVNIVEKKIISKNCARSLSQSYFIKNGVTITTATLTISQDNETINDVLGDNPWISIYIFCNNYFFYYLEDKTK